MSVRKKTVRDLKFAEIRLLTCYVYFSTYLEMDSSVASCEENEMAL